MIERSEIQFGKTRIPFVIHRSDRRGTVALAIDGARLVVTAPKSTSIERLNAVVHGKALWVKQALRSTTLSPPEREFVSGECFRYLGRQYHLKIFRARTEVDVKLVGAWIVVRVPDVYEAQRSRLVREALIRWYRSHAEERLPERAEVWAKKLGIATPTVLVRDQRRRWGSCNKSGDVRLNWRIIQAPLALIDYVVAHELNHVVLNEHGHGSAFWAHLGRMMRDYDVRRDRLRALGASLEW